MRTGDDEFTEIGFDRYQPAIDELFADDPEDTLPDAGEGRPATVSTAPELLQLSGFADWNGNRTIQLRAMDAASPT